MYMCVVVCSSFLDAGKKPACFASVFHQASTAWEASIRVIVPGDPSSEGLVHRELDRHHPSLPRIGHQGERFHCGSSSGRALDRLLRGPLLVDAIGPVWHFLCNPSRGTERKISVPGVSAQARHACAQLLRAVLDIVVPKIGHGLE